MSAINSIAPSVRPLTQYELDALIQRAITSVPIKAEYERAALVPFFAAIGFTLKPFKWQVAEAAVLYDHIQNCIKDMQQYLSYFVKAPASSPFVGWQRDVPPFPGYRLLQIYNAIEAHSSLEYRLHAHPIRKKIDETFAPYLQIKPPPIPYPMERRFEHTWICGTNGSGKTTLLKRLILHDLKADKPPSVVVVEDQADLIPWLTRLDLFHPKHGKLKDKLILFSPSQPPPPINIFDRYTGGEEGIEDTLDILRYIFGKLDVDMTGLQGSLFEPCARFLLTFPDIIGKAASLNDFVRLLGSPTPREYLDAIKLLDTDPQTAQGQARVFMDGLFHTETFKNTKTELQRRLATIGTRGYLGRMLSVEETGLNLYKLLNEGTVIAIDAAGLGDSSTLYGQVCISLVLQAIFARHTIPQQSRKPTFLYVDEAQKYFDVKTRNVLTNARKFRMGGVFAHQQLSDFKENGLEPYLTGQTSIRIVGRAPPTDYTRLAAYVNARPGATAAQLHDPQFIANLPDHHFACWIRNVTKPHGIIVSVDAELVENELGMDKDGHDELLRKNRQKMQQRRKQQSQQPPNGSGRNAPPPSQPNSEPPPRWTKENARDLAETAKQFAHAIYEGNKKRADELQARMDDLLDRKDASERYYGEDPDPENRSYRL